MLLIILDKDVILFDNHINTFNKIFNFLLLEMQFFY